MKNNRLIYLLIIILVIWNAFLSINEVNNKKEAKDSQVINNVVNGFSTDLTEVVVKCKASAVSIVSGSQEESGFIYKNSNDKFYVVGASHGLNDNKNVKVILDSGKEYDGKVIGQDIFADVAVVEVSSNIMVPEISFADSDILKAGEFLITIGTPTNTEYSSSVDLALVSSPLRTILNSIKVDDKNYDYYTSLVQLDSDMVNGYSGAPSFNMNGDLTCMIVMKNDTAVFAIPINEIRIIADKIINEEEYFKANLNVKGLYVKDLENYEKNNLNISLDVISGYVITNVELNGFGYNVGLRVGDILLSINDREINTHNDLLQVEYSSANEYNFKLIRDNEEINLIGSIDD